METILFRGKRKDDGEWIEGYYVKALNCYDTRKHHFIFPSDTLILPDSEFTSHVEIIPETLGRLIDRPCYDGPCTNQRFFQGDIIAVYRDRRADIVNDRPDTVAIVVDEHSITENGHGLWFPQDTTAIKVVGNVYDNPELVGKKYADLYKHYHSYKKGE